MSLTAPCYSKVSYYEYFQFSKRGKSILDIGSSIGSFNKSKKFSGSSADLASAKRYVTMDIDPDSGADIIGDAHRLPFKKDEFDIIVANNVIEHFYDPETAVSEMFRVLKKGGIIYFTVPFLYPVHEAPYDFSRLTRFGIIKLFENFKKVDIHERGGFFSTSANLAFTLTRVFDSIKIGGFIRVLLYPVFWLLVQLDRLDKTKAFTRVYFGKVQK